MIDKTEAIVIGAGVIGLAIARRLAQEGYETVIVEAADRIGTQISSHNSEVLHAGIYYPKNSLKARLCVAGKEKLYTYCADHGIAHTRVGKLIVATDDEQIARLKSLQEAAMGNGVSDLRWLDGETAAGLEPSLHCRAALLSPSTGIIDSNALMLALLGDAEDKGAVLALRSPVQGGDAGGDGISLRVGGQHPITLQARIVVNAAGLSAQAVAESITGLEKKHIPPLYLAKGNYFVMSGHPPFSRLIYPLPGPASLGIHFSLDMGGRGSFGPDVEWVGEVNYGVHPSRAESFYAAIRSYYPDLADGALRPSFAGVRPKLQGPGEAMKDFVIQSPRDHGVSGLINLFGIESPGLTSSLALADYVVGLLEET